MIKSVLRKNNVARSSYGLVAALNQFFKFKPFLCIKQYVWFFKKLLVFKNEVNPEFRKLEFCPCLCDDISYTPLDPTYFYQDTWAAKKIFELRPEKHYDIGSSAKTIGILSQYVPITMVDIRPLELDLENLYFEKGDILNLPFEEESVDSLSSLCVVEHIGLGRYGDQMDAFGSEKAIFELKRVLKKGGILLISIPVDSENNVYFNAHRAFAREYLIKLFMDFEILEEKYIYGKKLYDNYDKNRGFGTGLFMLKKR